MDSVDGSYVVHTFTDAGVVTTRHASEDAYDAIRKEQLVQPAFEVQHPVSPDSVLRATPKFCWEQNCNQCKPFKNCWCYDGTGHWQMKTCQF